jgi:type II secretory pathway pseudopilin PulG
MKTAYRRTHDTRHTGPMTPGRRDGMTLVEILIAMALVVMMCAGILTVVLKAKRFAEHTRVATAARGLAKERLEEMIAAGLEDVAAPACMYTNLTLHTTMIGYNVQRQARLYWHDVDGSVTARTNAAYAEAHVDVIYDSPLINGLQTDTYSGIVD